MRSVCDCVVFTCEVYVIECNASYTTRHATSTLARTTTPTNSIERTSEITKIALNMLQGTNKKPTTHKTSACWQKKSFAFATFERRTTDFQVQNHIISLPTLYMHYVRTNVFHETGEYGVVCGCLQMEENEQLLITPGSHWRPYEFIERNIILQLKEVEKKRCQITCISMLSSRPYRSFGMNKTYCIQTHTRALTTSSSSRNANEWKYGDMMRH